MSNPALSQKAQLRLLALDNTAFVTTCYRILLGRDPDIGGFENYVSLLKSGLTKEEVLPSFLTSEEFRWRDPSGDLLTQISGFVETAGTLDYSDRDFLDSVASLVIPDCMNLLPQ